MQEINFSEWLLELLIYMFESPQISYITSNSNQICIKYMIW